MRATETTPPPMPPPTPVPDRAAAEAHVAEVVGLDRAERLLDDAALSELLGFPVRAARLRLKPGRSLVVAWERTDGSDGEAQSVARHGWTAVSADEDKHRKDLAEADRLGRPLTVHQQGPAHLVSGSVWTDRALGRELAKAAQEVDGGTWQVLRFNPRRRVVAAVPRRGRTRVLRVAAHDLSASVAAAARWRALEIPVPPIRAAGDRGTATLSPLWGAGDLFTLPDAEVAEIAGATIARLHARSAERPVPRRAGGRRPVPRVSTDVDAAVQAIVTTAPWLADRAPALGERLRPLLAAEEHEPAEIHGDLSPDQVLRADPQGRSIRLIDLDRAGLAPAMRDVGSWTASCRAAGTGDLAEGFLHGYRRIAAIDPRGMARWEAHAHLSAALDPFRSRSPQWPQEVTARLSWAEQALQTAEEHR